MAETGFVLVTCRGADVELEAENAPAATVFRELERRCGLAIRNRELLPADLLKVTYRGRALEDVVADLVRITGLPSTLSATGPGESLTLYLLPTGAALLAPGGASQAGGGAAEDHAGEPRSRETAGGASARREARGPEGILAEIERLDADEAWVLARLSAATLLGERAEAEAESLLRRHLASVTDEERRSAFEALTTAGPSPVTGRPWTEEEIEDERWRLTWQSARRAFLLGVTPAARQEALGRLRLVNADEAAHLEGLASEALERERIGERIDLLREEYLLSRGTEQWRRRFEEEARARSPETK